MARRKCGFEACSRKTVLVLGDCRYCKGQYCGVHRLPEAHACPNLAQCRTQAFERNRSRLLEAQTEHRKLERI